MAESINITDLAVKVSSALTTADQIMVFDQTGDTNRTPLFEAVAQANGENGCLCVQTAKVELTPAQVIAGGPYAFGISTSAGEFISPLRAFIKIDHAGADFDQGGIGLRFVGGSVFANFSSLDTSVDAFSGLDFSSQIGSGEYIVENADIEIYMPTPPTVGGSTVTFYLVYTVIDI